jgi:coenzyme F420-reducing hydrogenase gamma subunit
VEAGPIDEEAEVDIAFVEGSISTSEEADRIRRVRANSRYLVAIGACATSGGVQALRNRHDTGAWTAAIYDQPEHISVLDTASALSDHVRVDFELYGCPVNAHQVLATVRALLSDVTPVRNRDKLCGECKRLHNVCVMVARGLPCMGPVTVTGCGVLCPGMGRDCYACYGPAENVNTGALARQLEELGLSPDGVARRFLSIHNNAPAFAKVGPSEE